MPLFQNPNINKYGLVSLGLIIVFIATAHTFSYEESVINGYKDVETYTFIANHGFEDGVGQKYYNHHLERWPIHVLVGYLSRLSNFSLWSTYRIGVLVLVFICFLTIKSLKVSDIKKIAIFSFILFNPYSFRPCFAAPGMISDCALIVGFLVLMCGIINNNSFQIITGVLFAVISKQTGILLIPILIILYYFKYVSIRILIMSCIFLVFMFIFIKLLTIHFYGESSSGYFVKHAFGIFSWLFNEPTIKSAISFFGRYILFLLTLSGFILLIDQDYKHLWLFIAIFFFIHSQPLAGGPLITAGNIQRLSAHGLPFLIPLVVNSNSNNKTIIYFIIISVLVSLHHQSSILYNLDSGNIIFLLLVLSSLPISLYLKHTLSKIKN